MSNLVKLQGDRVEFPYLSMQYAITPSEAKLAEGLEAYRELREDLSLQTMALDQRKEVSRFLLRYGQLLFRTMFPGGDFSRLNAASPLLLQLSPEWHAFPWELLHDGNGFLALGRGVLRYLDRPGQVEPPTGKNKPLKVLGVRAEPLTGGEGDSFLTHREKLGTRFLTPIDALMDQAPHGEAGPQYRPMDHASRADLETLLEREPGLVYFSGFSDEEGWFMESPGGAGEKVSHEWLAARLGSAARAGLKAVISKDSLGILEPRATLGQTEALLRAGVPALIRIEGRQARLREREYLSTLSRHLNQGASVSEAHSAGIRRLHRRFEESWDWSFFRLFQRSLPPPPQAAVPSGTKPDILQTEDEQEPPFSLLPPPPVFQRRKRVFGRYGERAQLSQALLPHREDVSPLVFLTGAKGAGKTALALEAAKKASRRFGVVVYLHLADLESVQEPAGETAGKEGGGGSEWLEVLIRKMGAESLLANPPEKWAEEFLNWMTLGPPRLIILDGFEAHPDFEPLTELLSKVSPAHRIILTSRGSPPLVAGTQVELPPLEEGRFLFDAAFIKRLEKVPDGGALKEACKKDVLLARILWRLSRWPLTAEFKEAVVQGTGENGLNTQPLLGLVAQATVKELNSPARKTLEALALFPGLVHREALALLTGMEAKTLGQTLAELQWKGLIDSYDSELYASLPHRLQVPLVEQLVTGKVYSRLRPLLLKHYRNFMGAFSGRMEGLGGALHEDFHGWRNEEAQQERSEHLRFFQRVAIEQNGLQEMAMILAEEQDWEALQSLENSARSMYQLPGGEPLEVLMNRLLLDGGLAQGDALMQATSLCALARPLLARKQAEKAQPLLEKALDLLGQTEGWEELGRTYLHLSQCYEMLERPERAVNMLHAAVELARQSGHSEAMLEGVEELVRLWNRQGESAAQITRYLSQVVSSLEEMRAPLAVARVKRTLGGLALSEGQGLEAERMYGEILEVFEATGQSKDIYLTLLGLCEVHIQNQQSDMAARKLAEARARQERKASRKEEIKVLEGLSRLFQREGRYSEALGGFLEVKELYEKQSDRSGMIRTLDVVGGLYFQLGQKEASTRCYSERLELQDALT